MTEEATQGSEYSPDGGVYGAGRKSANQYLIDEGKLFSKVLIYGQRTTLQRPSQVPPGFGRILCQ